jgi:hypothetical protein
MLPYNACETFGPPALLYPHCFSQKNTSGRRPCERTKTTYSTATTKTPPRTLSCVCRPGLRAPISISTVIFVYQETYGPYHYVGLIGELA